MKSEYADNKIIVYSVINNDIKKLLKNIFNNIINNQLNLYESYNVIIYSNKYYGNVIEVEPSTSCFAVNKVCLKINVINDKLFLYEVDDPLDYEYYEAYYYEDKFYINIKKKNIRLFESAKVIYDDFVYKILGRGIKI